jgi:hypothetical protein
MPGQSRARWPDTLSTDERIAIAQRRLPDMVDTVLRLIHLHESNQIINYSRTLADQIPRSYAANAFILFQRTMLDGEFIQLCTLWDPVREHRRSLPTIGALVSSHDVLEELRRRAVSSDKSNRSLSAQDNDPELLKWLEEMSDREAEQRARKSTNALRAALDEIQTIQRSEMLKAVRAFRDNRLAHSLDRPQPTTPQRPAKYGDERVLLEKTIELVDALYLGVCRTGMHWEGAREDAKSYAEALWHGCRFEILS